MVGHDVMSPPLKDVRVNRANKVTELHSALTKELNWFTEMWTEERTAFLEAQGKVIELQERVNRQDIVIRAFEDTISDLRKEVASLTKPRKRPKRHSPHYKKTSSGKL